MTNKQKSVFKIVLGVFFIINFFYSKEKIIIENELVTKTVTVNDEIYKNEGHGRNSTNSAVIFGTKEYLNRFVVEKNGIKNIEWRFLEDIKSNDQLIIKFHRDRLSTLDDKSGEDVPIYTLIKNNKVIYNLNEYNKSKTEFGLNWKFLGLLFGLYLTISELVVYKKKQSAHSFKKKTSKSKKSYC